MHELIHDLRIIATRILRTTADRLEDPYAAALRRNSEALEANTQAREELGKKATP